MYVFSVGWSRMKNVVYEGNNFAALTPRVFSPLPATLRSRVWIYVCVCVFADALAQVNSVRRIARLPQPCVCDEPNLISRKDAAAAQQLKNGVAVINDSVS